MTPHSSLTKRTPVVCRLFWTSFVILFTSLSLQAATSGLFTYEVKADNTIEITDYPEDATGTVLIPTTIDGKAVTSIGAYAFRSCSEITGVTIPSSVVIIGDRAFYLCYSLTGITVEAGNTQFTSVNGVLFNSTQTTLIQYPGGKTGAYTIPNTVTTIGRYGFAECPGLTGVTIPVGVTDLGYQGFAACIGLESVVIPHGVTELDYAVFRFCTSMTSVTIPSSVETIDYQAFRACFSLKHVIIPDGVTSIGIAAFRKCTSLETVTIPQSVTRISSDAFFENGALLSIDVHASNTDFSSDNGVLYNGDQTTLIQYPGAKIGAYTIPQSVTRINGSSFLGSTGLTSITIPSSATGLSGTGLYSSENLTEYIVEPGNPTFSSLNGILLSADQTVLHQYPDGKQGAGIIPSTVTSIAPEAFMGSSGLTSLSVAAGNTAFVSSGGVVFNPALTTLVQYPTGKVGTYAVPAGVTTIGSYAFAGSESLTDITFSASVTTIDEYAFYECRGLINLTIPEGITTIGERAFLTCSELVQISLPNSLISMGEAIFYNCYQLHSISIPGNITEIPRYAFHRCSHLTTVNLPNGLTSINNYAFGGCHLLANINFPSSLTSIGDIAFDECRSLTEVLLPDNIMILQSRVFRSCSNLTHVKLPANLTTMEVWAFVSCPSLKSIIIPPGVTDIDSYAFSGCSSLEVAYFSGNAPTLSSSVFRNVHENFVVRYLDSSTGFTSPTWYGYPTQAINTTTHPAAKWLLEANHAYDTNLNQDLNGDGVPLLMAYALNLNTNQRLHQNLPKVKLNPDSLSIDYYSGSAGVTYRVETSKDLDTWVTTNVTISDPDTDGIRTASIPRDEACGFLRLVIVEE